MRVKNYPIVSGFPMVDFVKKDDSFLVSSDLLTHEIDFKSGYTEKTRTFKVTLGSKHTDNIISGKIQTGDFKFSSVDCCILSVTENPLYPFQQVTKVKINIKNVTVTPVGNVIIDYTIQGDTLAFQNNMVVNVYVYIKGQSFNK